MKFSNHWALLFLKSRDVPFHLVVLRGPKKEKGLSQHECTATFKLFSGCVLTYKMCLYQPRQMYKALSAKEGGSSFCLE